MCLEITNPQNNLDYVYFVANNLIKLRGFQFLVILKAGTEQNVGNIYTVNPETGIEGHVCDDSWDLNGVNYSVGQASLIELLFRVSFDHF